MTLATAAFHDEVKEAYYNHYESHHCHPVEFHVTLLSCGARHLPGISQSINLNCDALILPTSHLQSILIFILQKLHRSNAILF